MIQRHTPRLVVMWIRNFSQNSHPLLATTADKQVVIDKVTSAIAKMLVQITPDSVISYGSMKYCCSKRRSLK